MVSLFSHKRWLSIRGLILKHKIVSAVVAVVVVFGGYKAYSALTSTAGETRYVVATATKGTLVSSISGSGQVATVDQVDIKPKVSGTITSIYVKNGDTVKAGTLIASIDARDALRAVRDAEVNLESAKLSLEKLTAPADDLSLIQSQNSVDKANESKQNSEDNLKKQYDDAFTSIANTFLDLPAIMTNLQSILYTTDNALGGSSRWNIDFYTDAAAHYDRTQATLFRTDTDTKYQTARASFDKTFTDYKVASRFSDNATVEKLLDEAYETSKNVSEAIKSANNLIQFYEDQLTTNNLTPLPLANTHIANLGTYAGKVNSHLSDLVTVRNGIKDDKNAITNADRTIAESTESLAKLKSGATDLDIQSAQISVKQRENSLLDAQTALSDYSLRAPFDGVITKVSLKKGDAAGSGTAVATLATSQKIAQISLNEVDASKVKIGQKVTLTFDAIDGLSIAGQVSDLDTAGTVSQGVVTYAVQIGFDTQDDRVKSGMTVSAAIITNVKSDIITVPSSAVKTQGQNSYVLVFNPPLTASDVTSTTGIISKIPPTQQAVTTGTSNDTDTEIVSGLTEGTQIVTRTIAPSTTAATTQAPSLFGGNTRATGATTGAFRGTAR